ncbi:MAG: YaiO family outer membrane beta-barrel protein [Candidatus Aminicenantes bacterium]|nr:YaiO family outer membrane beta-barrel protein [Candidatus Aminicenantes bacterium]
MPLKDSAFIQVSPDQQNLIEREKEKIKKALQLGQYSQAIELCLQGLKVLPEDFELNFWLAQAYAFSGNWDRALEQIEYLNRKYPGNNDVLLLEARILSWKKNYLTAKEKYHLVLKNEPQNLEAKIGLAQIASWEGKYSEAISGFRHLLTDYPEKAELHYLLGLTYLWSGNYGQAKQSLKRATELDPNNQSYREAYRRSLSLFPNRFEIRSELAVETFSDGRENYLDRSLIAEAKIPPSRGSILLTWEETKRFGTKDTQLGLELYPHLWPQAYGHFYIKGSFKAHHFPQTSYHFELYQGIGRLFEFSGGFQKMNFKNNPVSIFLGSFGAYLGNYYGHFRWYYSPEKVGSTFSWVVHGRRYWRQQSYVFFAYGQGARAYETISWLDLLAHDSTIVQAGLDTYLWHHFRLRAQITKRKEENINRLTYALILGAAW